jgi:hypothetical protein
MVGELKNFHNAGGQLRVHDLRLMSLRCAHRRSVAGSGDRVGSLVCGADCSQLAPGWHIDSQALRRQRKL